MVGAKSEGLYSEVVMKHGVAIERERTISERSKSYENFDIPVDFGRLLFLNIGLGI